MNVEEILTALRAIVEGAVGETGEQRDLTEEEAQRYEQLEVQLRSAQRNDQIRQRQAAYDVVPNPPLGPSSGPSQDDTLERAFADWVRTGHENADVVELRAQGEGTGSAGGYLVPTTLMARLTDRMKAFGGLESVADVLTTSSGETLVWPTLDDTANQGEIVAESGAPTTGADLVFDKRELGAYRFSSTGAGGNPLRVSIELLADNQFDIEGRVMAKLGERIARHAAPKFVDGTGVGEPQGIVTGATVANGRAVEVGNGTSITYATLIDVEHAVDPAYRQMGNCRWAFNDAALALIKKLVDSNGDPLWLPVTNDRLAANLFNGVLLGYPVTIDQGFDAFSAASNTVMWGVFGDIREGLVVRNVSGLIVIRDPYARKSNGEVEFVAHARKDSIQNERNAYVTMTGFIA